MKPQKQLLTYIKLPEYMIPLVLKRFGNPVIFDAGSRIAKVFNSSLISIEDMERKYSKISCSQHAYNIAKAKRKGQLDASQFVGTPSGDDIDMFVPVVMPLHIMVKDDNLGFKRSVPVTGYHTLTLAAAQKIRMMIRQIFWTDLSQYHKDYAPDDTHKENNFRFLAIQNISDDMFETVCRTECRLQSEMK